MPDIKTFSVLDAAKGRSYPTDEVTVYTDVASLYHLNELDAIANDAETGDEANVVEPEIAELREKIKASAMTFYLRGFSPGVRESINDEARAKFGDDVSLDKGDPLVWRLNRYINESIITVTNAEGAVDKHRWTYDDVVSLRGFLPDEEFLKIQDKMFELSLASWKFDEAVNADF